MALNQLATMRKTRRAAIAAAATATVLMTGACSDDTPSPDAQRETMIKTTRAVIDMTAESMLTEAIRVADDGTALRPCPDGGSQYTYAATIGPTAWDKYANSLSQGISRTETQVLGGVQLLQRDPRLDDFPQFDDFEYPESAGPEGAQSMTYVVSRGEGKGLTLRYVISASRDALVVTEIVGATVCG